MRKALFVVLCVMLIGCQSSKDIPEIVQPTKQKEDLIYKDWRYLSEKGDANENGYYFIKSEENSIHLAYYDYATKQEVYLCNKPECQHQDNTCTAYLDDAGITCELFVHKNHLYLVNNAGLSINALGESQATGSKIIQMDLDGQNRKDIYLLDDDYAFEYNSLIVDDSCLYIPVIKNKRIEFVENSFMDVTVEKHLYKIDLEKGEGQQVIDMKYKNILGVDKRTIVMSVDQYDEDPVKFLMENNYTKYDQIISNAKTNYAIYDMDTQETKIIAANKKNIGNYYQKNIYYIENSMLYALDLNTEEEQIILDLEFDGNISIIMNDYIVVEMWENNEFNHHYKISLTNPKLEELTQYLRIPKEPVRILAQMSNQLLVMYDREGQHKKTWAGTMQYETSKEYIGLISIQDYFNNQTNYQQINTLTERRLF